MPARRRRWVRPIPPAWTKEEEEKLQEISRIGLTCDCWKSVFPERTFGDVAEKRLIMREEGRIVYPRSI